MSDLGSILDEAEFNRRLFFPRADRGGPPKGAHDRTVDVDGAKLQVRVHGSRDGAPTLLLFPGNGEVCSDYDALAPRFARAGAALAVASFRGYGKSTGVPTLRAIVTDAPRIAAAVAIGPMVVMGRSLGAVAAHELYARPVDGMIGVILESALFDLTELVRRRDLTPPAKWSSEERATFAPATKLSKGKLPLLVLHGADDDIVAPREARSAFGAAGAPPAHKTLVMVPDRGHNDIGDSGVYWSAIEAFLESLAER